MDIAKKFQDLAKKSPQTPFIIFKEHSMSYGECAEKVNRLAGALLQAGAGKTDKVAVYLPNSCEYVISYLAVFSLGAAVVPLDVRLTGNELIGILNHSECSFFITKPLKEISFAELKAKAPGLKNIIECFSADVQEDGVLNFEEMMQDASGKQLNLPVREEDLAILYYTSGTTGKPKAVMSNYRSLDNAPATIKSFLKDEDLGNVAICALPLSHLGGFVYLQLALEFTMTIVLMERFIPIEFLQNIEKHKVTWFHLVPAMFNAILQLKEFEKYDLSSVKGVDIFGAPSHPNLIQRFGRYCAKATLWHGWGMTETAAPNTIAGPGHITSVGKAPPWFKLKIVDNCGQGLATGEVGEIICSGWPIMMGYYKEPELTSEIIRDSWLYTGDLGCLDQEGYLYIKGRKKDMIIVGGLNVYAPEVEQVIAEHPQVKEVAVVGIPDKLRGETIKAVVVLREAGEHLAKDIQAFCRTRLIHFKVPQVIEVRASLPKTSSGKIQKELLKIEEG